MEILGFACWYCTFNKNIYTNIIQCFLSELKIKLPPKIYDTMKL